jgi:hypothetical protein
MRQRTSNLTLQQHLYQYTIKTFKFNQFVAIHSSSALTSIFPFPSSYLYLGFPKTAPLLRPWSFSVINPPAGLSGLTRNLGIPLLAQQ